MRLTSPMASDTEKIAAEIGNISDELGERLGDLNRALYDTSLRLNDSSRKLTDTIQKSSESADKHSTSMKYLTGALVLLTIVQAFFAYLPYKQNKDEINVRKNCFQSVLQTSDIDLNYKNCLRDHGLVE